MLDVRTVMILLIMATSVAALGLLLVRRYYLPVPGVGQWAFGSALVAVAQSLSLARDHLPPLLGIVISNGLTVVALVVMLAGFQRFTATRVTVLGPGLLVAAGVMALLAWFTFVVPTFGGRVITLAATLCVFNGVIAWILWPDTDADEPARRACAAVYFVSMLFYARCAWVWFDQSPTGLFSGGDLVAVVFAFAFVKVLCNSFLQLILVSERLNAELRRQAEHDPLTGALNRRAFTLVAEKALAQAARTGQPLTLLMTGLDHFKRANDGQGHAFGDSLLCDFVRLAQEMLRAQDSFSRHGGEEFVILLPGITPDQALVVAERLRQAYAGLPAARTVRGTVSVGLAAYRPGDVLDTLLCRADRALHQAKESGRTVIAEFPGWREVAIPVEAG